jgi:ACR3 family arsenite efflux pump ArsB
MMMMMISVQGEENQEVNVGVCAIGLVIYKDQIRLHRYPWAKILKIAYKKNKFLVKIRPGEVR